MRRRGVSKSWRVEAREHDGRIANQPCAALDRMGIETLAYVVGFSTRHKVAVRLVQAMQPLEVDVAAVHDVESAGLWDQQMEDIDVVQFAVEPRFGPGRRAGRVVACWQFRP